MASEGLRYTSNVQGLQKPYRGFSRLVFDCLSSFNIDNLVPVILLEYDGRPGEDGAGTQATTEIML